jgi:hypothetical protein
MASRARCGPTATRHELSPAYPRNGGGDAIPVEQRPRVPGEAREHPAREEPSQLIEAPSRAILNRIVHSCLLPGELLYALGVRGWWLEGRVRGWRYWGARSSFFRFLIIITM